MGDWRNYQIYYTDLDGLITRCVYPALRTVAPSLEKCFFERHHAGGAHLRVRFRGDKPTLERVGEGFVTNVRAFLKEHPSQPTGSYSPERARELMKIQGEEANEEELQYRVNTIAERPYHRLRHQLASDEAASLLEDFLGDCMGIVYEVLTGERPRTDALLGLFFLQALYVGGSLPAGSVSYKAHWEGFAAGFSSRTTIDGIRSSYERNRESIRNLMLSIHESVQQGRPLADPLFAKWHDLLVRYRRRTETALHQGVSITRQPTWAEARDAKERVLDAMREDSAFMRTLLKDERFLALFQFEEKLLWPRVLTNLLYMMVSAAGVNMIGRMALCYFAFRSVEEHYACDLTSILERTIDRVVQDHGGALEG